MTLDVHPPQAPPEHTDLGTMLLIRHVELALLRLFEEGRIGGTTHTCLGQEHVPVAVSGLLGPRDAVFSNHRGHGHYLARTGDVTGLLAEVLGRAGALCGGVGGSQHLYDGAFLSTGVQGESLPVAAGAALARLGSGDLALAYIGDGTWGEGAVYEALNLAALWRLPLVVVVENNGIAQSTPTRVQLAGSIAGRAAAFGIPYLGSAETDPGVLRTVLAPEFDRVRAGGGPLVVEVRTGRLGPHSKGDDTRDAATLAELRAGDWYARRDTPEIQAFDERVRERVEAAVVEVTGRPYAPAPVTAAWPVAEPGLAGRAGGRVGERINQALHAVLAADDTVHVFGEDIVDPYGGAFRITRGLSTRFPNRVRSTPISESAIVGVAAGLALAGQQAIVEMMFGDFVTLAMDPLVNFAAKSVSMYGRRVRVPLVVRLPVGGRRGYGPTHSQSPQKHLMGVPDLAVFEVTPFHDPTRLLAHQLGLGVPCVQVEDKILYTAPMYRDGVVDSVARYRFSGTGLGIAVVEPVGIDDVDAVLIVPGGLAHRAIEAARRLLLEDEICLRVLVPAQLYPVPADDLAELCRGAGPVLVAEDAPPGAGWGAEVANVLYPRLWSGLSGPIRTLSADDRVVPAAPHLERDVFRSADDLRAAVLSACGVPTSDREAGA